MGFTIFISNLFNAITKQDFLNLRTDIFISILQSVCQLQIYSILTWIFSDKMILPQKCQEYALGTVSLFSVQPIQSFLFTIQAMMNNNQL